MNKESLSRSGSQKQNQAPRRQKSLVRPERERNDPNNRLYHYRQRATQENTEPSTTGNEPTTTLQRKPTLRENILRRGKSILGREEEKDNRDIFAQQMIQEKEANKFKFNPWMTYCRILTCCIPKQLLRCVGIPDGPAQSAWREKIGLVSFILFIMGCVGFLTFGFTQVVCPIPALSVKGGQVGNGYLIINGWAYMLADWSHPTIPGAEGPTNILYEPWNGAGMDASFLFQQVQPICSNVLVPLQGEQPVYFPCQLFNPNVTTPPDPTQFMNRTSCHLSAASLNTYRGFQDQGVPNLTGGYHKSARVYYDWDDITPESGLSVYNGNVLNLKLLSSLPITHFRVPENGLIAQTLSDPLKFLGRDMTMIINLKENSADWELEARCLSALIKVGSLDTISIGCMASEIVLYVSLAVILGVIFVKFALAVIFGWFLSWKLGNFKEGKSYAARMEREQQIENWTTSMQAGAPLPLKPRTQSTYQGKRKSLFPQTSKFTQPRHGSTRFDGPGSSTSVWRTPNSALEGHVNRQSMYYVADGSRQSTYNLGSEGSSYNNNTSRASVFYNTPNTTRFLGAAAMNQDYARRGSINSASDANTHTTETSNGSPVCPFPLSPYAIPIPPVDYMPFHFPLAYTICLVTCYSEGEAGIRITLDSIATSDYPNSHKLLLVICDGLITGSGESKSTPDICVGMMRDLLVPDQDIKSNSYVALADGSRQNNMAKVYAGYYKYDDTTVAKEHQQRVPMITIVKCGTEAEQAEGGKPGNRGKRDSQIILMQFMQKVMFDERMTMMEYEFFNSIWRICGVPADVFEIVLMVDADTKLFPDALSRLISCAVKDPEISGLCGETKIANKTDSFVTMMQVFEYYISHHQSKAFESIFGGVTCLPGCFCMYRIKAPKGPDGYWVPILANPDIVERYSENVVDTLHKKNLLLLGEDRYLSTLMLRTFPNRKMMFVPQAVCKTVVPDTFMVLLSQRRRWINSTIHNLMELLFVHDLCGTFCFSMQFVIFMELVGTLALPAAISFTIYLIVLAIMGKPALIPLILLALILGLPAVLIVMTSRKIVYVGWMIVYLLSLPIWNFVLPTYAYWHFDDFSWGDTRKVEGVKDKKGGHADKSGEFDSSLITMKKWSEYEKERRIKEALANNLEMPRFLERGSGLSAMDMFMAKRYSKTGSAGSNDSDVPLTQMSHVPAGLNNKFTYQHTPQLRNFEDDEIQQLGSSSSHYHTAKESDRELVAGGEPVIPLTTLNEYANYTRDRNIYHAGLAHSTVYSNDEDDDEETQYNYINHQSVWSDPAPHHRTFDNNSSEEDDIRSPFNKNIPFNHNRP